MNDECSYYSTVTSSYYNKLAVAAASKYCMMVWCCACADWVGGASCGAGCGALHFFAACCSSVARTVVAAVTAAQQE